MKRSDACFLCKSYERELVLIKNSYPIVKCKGCGLIHVALEQDVERRDLVETYGEEYFTGKVYKNYFEEKPVRMRLFSRKFDLIRKHLPLTGKILDAGSAAGFFLEVARQRGYDTYGIEISEFASTYAREQLNLEVETGELQDSRFPANYFDVITMWDLLEHLPRPNETLMKARSLLKSGGELVIETLDVDCFNASVLRNKWPLYAPPFHLFYFSLRTLRMLLSRTGFKIIQVIPIQTYSPFHAHKAVRYFEQPLIIRMIIGRLFGDVVIVIARKI